MHVLSNTERMRWTSMYVQTDIRLYYFFFFGIMHVTIHEGKMGDLHSHRDHHYVLHRV